MIGTSRFISYKLYKYFKDKKKDVKSIYYLHKFEGPEEDKIYFNLY